MKSGCRGGRGRYNNNNIDNNTKGNIRGNSKKICK